MIDTELNTSKTRDMLGRHALIHVGEAQVILLDSLKKVEGTVHVDLDQALDHITASEVFAGEDLPSHPRSTMDGYAVIAADTFGATESMPCYLEVQGEILMGEKPTETLLPGNCFHIATGGLLPPGADAVVMFEHTVPVDAAMVEIVKSVGQGANVIQKGDDIAKGKRALPAGRKLRPQDLGLLAGLGIAEVETCRQVRMGILSTGDEIVPFTTVPQPGKIRNINSIAISSQARKMNVAVTDYGIVIDTKESFYPAIIKAVAENDLVVFSGGSSVGARDLGEKAITDLGSPGILVHGVALRPGKPIIIGLHGSTPIFGLPGHPVSAMVCFDLFVGPALQKLAGLSCDHAQTLPSVTAVLGKNIASAAGRRDIVRVELVQQDSSILAFPVLGKSGSISTLSRAHGYIIIEESLQGITQNSTVQVYIYQ